MFWIYWVVSMLKVVFHCSQSTVNVRRLLLCLGILKGQKSQSMIRKSIHPFSFRKKSNFGLKIVCTCLHCATAYRNRIPHGDWGFMESIIVLSTLAILSLLILPTALGDCCRYILSFADGKKHSLGMSSHSPRVTQVNSKPWYGFQGPWS